MHNFVCLTQRRSQEFTCEPSLGGGVVSPGSPCLRECSKIANDATGASAAAAADCDGSGGDVGGAVVERLCGRL